MSYRIYILRRAQKELSRIPARSFGQIKESIMRLGEDPLPRGCKKLTGREGWRIRVGDYRVIYDIDNSDRIVTVLHIGHRRDVYR